MERGKRSGSKRLGASPGGLLAERPAVLIDDDLGVGETTGPEGAVGPEVLVHQRHGLPVEQVEHDLRDGAVGLPDARIGGVFSDDEGANLPAPGSRVEAPSIEDVASPVIIGRFQG